jgi:hypothetical protein
MLSVFCSVLLLELLLGSPCRCMKLGCVEKRLVCIHVPFGNRDKYDLGYLREEANLGKYNVYINYI